MLFFFFNSEDIIVIINISFSGKFLEVLDNREGRIQKNARIKDSKTVESIWHTQIRSWEEFNDVGRTKIPPSLPDTIVASGQVTTSEPSNRSIYLCGKGHPKGQQPTYLIWQELVNKYPDFLCLK